MAELVYSVAEAARALGISRPTMYNLIHREEFPTLKVGSRRLISKELLAEWVRTQAGEQKETAPGATNTEDGKQTEHDTYINTKSAPIVPGTGKGSQDEK